MNITNDWVNISHSIGVPFGAIGTGYGVFGKFGFVRPNFNSIPDSEIYKNFRELKYSYYDKLGDDHNNNFLSLDFIVNGEEYSIQSEKVDNTTEIVADKFSSYVLLPFSKHTATYSKIGLIAEVLCYTPLIPYEIEVSTTPIFCMSITLKNISDKTIDGNLFFKKKDENETGIATAFLNGSDCEFSILANGEYNTEAFVAWYYPEFKTPSPRATDSYIRYYTKNFKNTDDIISYAKSNYIIWKEKIEKWHNSIGVPSPFKRLWFSSLSSVITSTMMSADPYFFEIESPHY